MVGIFSMCPHVELKRSHSLYRIKFVLIEVSLMWKFGRVNLAYIVIVKIIFLRVTFIDSWFDGLWEIWWLISQKKGELEQLHKISLHQQLGLTKKIAWTKPNRPVLSGSLFLKIGTGEYRSSSKRLTHLFRLGPIFVLDMYVCWPPFDVYSKDNDTNGF